jgi:conjugative transfer region lipoprotein (TIGR03751 family)
MLSTNLQRYRFALALVLAASVSACTTLPRDNPLPKEGPTMEQIYRGHYDRAASMGGSSQEVRARLPLRAATEFDPGPARLEAQEQIERRFARASNPDLVMTVFPHLTNGRYPVPGYVTMFPMYDSVEYLLPGEADSNFHGLR